MLIIISYRGRVAIDEPNKLILDMRACFWMSFEDLAPGRRITQPVTVTVSYLQPPN